MKIAKSKQPKTETTQTGILFHVIHSFCGQPVSVDTYDTEKLAKSRYECLTKIIRHRISQQNGVPEESVELKELISEKSVPMTSCSGLPAMFFAQTNENVAIVRGPMYERRRRKSTVPFIAVNLDGDLQVTVFQDQRDAKLMYDDIESKYRGSSTFQGFTEPGVRSFSVDADEGPSVMLGKAQIVRKYDTWKIK